MADVSKTVAIIFQGQDSGASIAARAVASGMAGVESATTAAAKSSDLWQDSAGKWRNSLGQFATDAEKAAAGIETLGKSSSSVDTLSNALKALATSIVIKEFISANVAAETFTKSMALLKGGATEAAVEFNYVKEISNTLGLRVSDASSAFISLTAATKGSALEGQATRDIFESVSKAMALLGRSTDDTNGALTAIGQIVSKGTVSMEELRGQLGERLPGAFGIAAKAMGVTTEQLNELVATGKLTAAEFLPKFAAELNKTFGETEYVDTFVAAQNRMRNSLDQTFQTIGEAGAFDLAAGAVTGLGKVFALTSVEISKITVIYDAVVNALRRGDVRPFFDDLAAGFEKFDAAYVKLLGTTDEYNESQAETERLARAQAAANEPYLESLAETARLQRQAITPAQELQASLAQIGVTSKDLGKVTSDAATGFAVLAANAEASSEIINIALKKALDKSNTLDDLSVIGGALTKAFTDGKLSAEEFGNGVLQLASKQAKVTEGSDLLSGSLKKQEEELKKTEEAAKKAKEAAEKYALEMEKLASNERIKLIEARVALNVAQVEADTARIQAAFESINNTINSTGDVIGSALGALKDITPNTDAFDLIQTQLETENQLRREAFELQKRLTEEQIKETQARTQMLLKGEALVKIDGAGLQPELEAFMWKILQTIQTRVNADGLSMLLGAA